MPNENETWEDAWARQAREGRERREREHQAYEQERAERKLRAEAQAADARAASVREELSYRESEASNLRGDVADLQDLLGRERQVVAVLKTELGAVISGATAFLAVLLANTTAHTRSHFPGEIHNAWSDLEELMESAAKCLK